MSDDEAGVGFLDRPRRRGSAAGHARRTIKRGMSADRRSSCSAVTCSAEIWSGASTVPRSRAGVPLSLITCQRTGMALARGGVGFFRTTRASQREIRGRWHLVSRMHSGRPPADLPANLEACPCNVKTGSEWQCAPPAALVGGMTKTLHAPLAFWLDKSLPIEGPDRIHQSFASEKTSVRTCICAGSEVPFYCPRHGRVENPDWPPLIAVQKSDHLP